MIPILLSILKTRKIKQVKQTTKQKTKQKKQNKMSSFTIAKQSRSQEEQKQFVVPSVNKWTKVSRPQQQVRQNRRPQQQGRQQRRPQQQGRQQRRPQYRGRQNRRPYNNRRRTYRKKQLGPQKGTKIATGSLLDMAMIKHKDGSKSVKVQSSRNGKRVIQHASLSQVLTKKDVKYSSNNSFSALDQEETVRKIVPRPTVIKTVAAPQGKWGAPLSSKVKIDEEFKYESGSQLEKQHIERLAELEEEKLAEQEIDRQIRTGEYQVESWADEMDSEDEDDFQDNRKLGDGYDLSFQPDVDDDDYEEYCQLQNELARQEYNHQAEIVQLDGWYD